MESGGIKKYRLEELARPDLETYRHSAKLPVEVVLDNLRSAHNVGSFFRTADAFCIQRLHLCGYTPCPGHRSLEKVALGATDSVGWEAHASVVDCLHRLRDRQYGLWGVEQTNRSVSLERFDWPGHAPLALLFGNEVDGLSEEALPWLDGALEVPQGGTKHSLNVSVCGGAVLWEAYRRLGPPATDAG
jgi:tRNA G18 (ribose-2'-O)-methylase SpoU